MTHFIRIGNDLVINRAEVASLAWDRRHYFNGPGDSFLVITMNDGTRHRVRHEPHYLCGIDCYKIEKEIIGD